MSNGTALPLPCDRGVWQPDSASCLCDGHWTGDVCHTPYRSVVWNALVPIDVVMLVLHVIMLGVCVQQLRVAYALNAADDGAHQRQRRLRFAAAAAAAGGDGRLSGGSFRGGTGRRRYLCPRLCPAVRANWSIKLSLCTLLVSASTVRIAYYLCSASSGLVEAVATRIDVVSDTLLFEVPVIALLTATLQVVLFWAEIASGLVAVAGLKRLRPVLVVLTAIYTSVSIFLSLLYALWTEWTRTALLAYNVWQCVWFAALCVAMFVWGQRLRALLPRHHNHDSTSSSSAAVKIARLMTLIGCGAGSAIIVLALGTAFGWYTHPWSWMVCSALNRAQELFIQFCLVYSLFQRADPSAKADAAAAGADSSAESDPDVDGAATGAGGDRGYANQTIDAANKAIRREALAAARAANEAATAAAEAAAAAAAAREPAPIALTVTGWGTGRVVADAALAAAAADAAPQSPSAAALASGAGVSAVAPGTSPSAGERQQLGASAAGDPSYGAVVSADVTLAIAAASTAAAATATATPTTPVRAASMSTSVLPPPPPLPPPMAGGGTERRVSRSDSRDRHRRTSHSTSSRTSASGGGGGSSRAKSSANTNAAALAAGRPDLIDTRALSVWVDDEPASPPPAPPPAAAAAPASPPAGPAATAAVTIASPSVSTVASALGAPLSPAGALAAASQPLLDADGGSGGR